MAEKILKTVIKLRRDIINNYASVSNKIPGKGEVCIVDPTATSPWANRKAIRIKIGDGVTSFSNLPYIDQQNSSIFTGFYKDGNFYFDVNCTELYEVDDEDFSTKLFIDLREGKLYFHDGEKFVCNNDSIPTATDTTPGIMKLYQTHGQNTDGAMSQKAVTDAISAIKLVVDESDTELFKLEKPW